MQGKIYWKLDVQNGPVREWSLSTENPEYNRLSSRDNREFLNAKTRIIG